MNWTFDSLPYMWINKNLEEQAQAIFDTGFVEKNKSDNKNQKGWRKGCLSDIAQSIVCGKTPSTKKPDYYGEDMPFMDSVNQTLYENVKDFFEVRSLDEITDISSIKLIRKNAQEGQSKVINIEEPGAVNEIVEVLKSSEVSYMGRPSYEDLLILTKKDGSEIELQITPYYLGMVAGEG
ncbi:MAG: hypothetical protein ACFN4Y_02950, partial [Centipeda sp. (in: firmicutes)]